MSLYNYFYDKTPPTEPTCIRFYDENPVVSVMKYSKNMYVQANNDEIIKTCFSLFVMVIINNTIKLTDYMPSDRKYG